MRVGKIEKSNVTTNDIELYKKQTSKLSGVAFNANDVGLNKRIISIRLGDIENELILVNPIVTQLNDEKVVYFEKDSTKNKTRKTTRYKHIVVNTDNLGEVEFKPDKETWETTEEFMTDAGLLESVLVQRAIDAINGIDITHKFVAYNPQRTVKSKKGRNERVMLQSPDGDTVFVKYKKSSEFINKGYKILE